MEFTENIILENYKGKQPKKHVSTAPFECWYVIEFEEAIKEMRGPNKREQKEMEVAWVTLKFVAFREETVCKLWNDFANKNK